MIAGAWPPRRVAVLATIHLAALGVVVVAARSTSIRSDVGDQIVWINVAVIAAIASAAANGSFLVRARRAVSLRQQEVLTALEARAHLPLDAVPAAETASETTPLVSVPGLRFAHRPTCPMVAGKRTVPASVGQESCGWCTR